MSLFTEVELLIMGSVLGVLFFIVLVLGISELISYKKSKDKKIEELEKNIDSTEEKELQDRLKKVGIYETIDRMFEDATGKLNVITEEVEVNNIVSEKKEKMEPTIEVIEPLIEELDPVAVKIETEEEKSMDSREKAQIELLKVEEELEHEFSLEDTITNLEAIEEENAIISYQELLSNTAELNIVTCDDGDEPITMDEVFKMFQSQTDEDIDINEMLSSIPLSEAYNGNFRETPYLSPINGIEGESLTEIQLENTANLEKLEKEIRKTNEFLNILNELKKNLE